MERNRADIVDAACRVFAYHGYRGATMQLIAEEAGCTVPTLYAYFRGKRAILRGLLEAVLEELMSHFEAPMPAGLDLGQRLELLHQRQFEWVQRRRDALAFLMTLPEAAHEACAEGELPQAPKLYIDRLAEWLAANAAEGDLNGYSPQLAAYILWGIGQGFFMRWMDGDGMEPLVDQAGPMIRIFLHGIGGAV